VAQRGPVVITGAGNKGQLGEVLARAFAQGGDSLVLIDRTTAVAAERAEELKGTGVSVLALGVDLTDPAATADAGERVTRELGPARALVNAAGGFAMTGDLSASDPSGWDTQLSINLATAYLSTRAFLPALRQTGGAIVYFGAAAALPGGSAAGMAAYVAAKAGVLALMRAVSQAEREHGVRANAVAPTAIRTTANEESMGAELRYVEREEVAAVVRFLCSPEAHAVTGQVLRLG
jgi:NAD(P)-dependent dehydrogenase (short-subunit alcohol dehydrogenase family)